MADNKCILNKKTMTIDELIQQNVKLENESKELVEKISKNNEQIIKNLGVIEYLRGEEKKENPTE